MNRRGFSVERAGWFSVLRPDARFTPRRLSWDFHYLGDQPKGTDRVYVDSQKMAKPLQILQASTHDHSTSQSVLIVLAAIAITLGLLWWIAVPLF